MSSIRSLSSAAAIAVLGATLGAQQSIRVSDTGAMVRTWQTENAAHSAVSRDGGKSWVQLPDAQHELTWRSRSFDPKDGDPAIPANLLANEHNELFYVQFMTDIIPEYHQVLERFGADAIRYYPHQAYLVRMERDSVDRVREEPYVRAVMEMQLGHKLDSDIQEGLLDGTQGTARYNIMLMNKYADATALEQRIEALGGVLEHGAEGGVLVSATLTPSQLRAVGHENTVVWIDRWTAPENDVDNARIQAGINYVETQAGIDGKGYRGNINEGVHEGHPEFAARAPWRADVIQFGANGAQSHGTNTAGIIYAQGLAGGVKGILPYGQMIESNRANARYSHIAEMWNPAFPYQVFSTSQSWGGGRTRNYTTKSAELDDALFDYDHMFATQSQSNAGNNNSRPEAWAKNVCGIGGFYHRNNADPADDCWCGGGSTGPAQDGRVGVSFTGYYDNIRTTNPTGYSNSFGGTSGATPIVNGLTGAGLQIFTDGLLGYPAVAWDDRQSGVPNLTTTRVMHAVTTRQLNFVGTNRANRVQQGWGFPNIQDLYDLRDEILVLDEEDVLTQGQTRNYWVWVKPGTPQLRASMHHLEDEAVPSAIPTRINSLDLTVSDRSGANVWLGNGAGILDGPWSATGGAANDIDIHENVFIQNPASGPYKVSVTATAVRADSHKETPAMDADFALAIRGIGGGRDRSGMTLDMASTGPGDLTCTVGNVPGGWVSGITMFSLDTDRHLSLGDTFGVNRDGLSQSIIKQVSTPSAGSVLSFTNVAGNYPHVTYTFPTGVASNVSGRTLDAVVVLFDGSGNIVDVSNAARVDVQ